MPHLTLEYTNNLPKFLIDDALATLNETLVASGEFEEFDIKSRAIRMDTCRIGTAPEGRAFVHAKLAILSGRTMQTKRAVSESLLQELKRLCAGHDGLQVQLCVEILEIERDSYAKASIG